ncbi:MAG TPA: hypothetical protein VFO55_12515 [Gemmatimonadaceae bacterium]|nr:hypothetical protein [Gemmatimonadaceae bacterium]
MLINLLPDFFALLDSSDPAAAYNRYFEAHRRLLEAYWLNYVIEPVGPHFQDIVRSTVTADRSDLRAMLERTDVVTLARAAEMRTREALSADVDVDVVLMVGVGAANAGELVVDGRGAAFLALEHFTGVTNDTTDGLGLDVELLPLWLAHEYSHAVRYTSPTSRSEMREVILESGGNYSYWETGRHVTLREHLVNEGLAVNASRAVSPGHAAWEYFGYQRKQYSRIRELEPVIRQAALAEAGGKGLGLRLKYLSDGVSEITRTVNRSVLPERSGYYLGARMVESAVETNGLDWAVRAGADEIEALHTAAVATA